MKEKLDARYYGTDYRLMLIYEFSKRKYLKKRNVNKNEPQRRFHIGIMAIWEKNMKRKYNMTREENIFVARRNIVDYIWKSANLEGLAVTFPETQAVYDGAGANLKVTDIITINNLKRAWHFVIDTIDADMDFRYVSQINKIIGGDNLIINAGQVRKIDVKIGGTTWIPKLPDEEIVKTEFENLLQTEDPYERSINIMLYLMRGQLFLDGNKRTAMLCANQVMIQNGLGIISVPLENQEKFKEKLVDFYETGNAEDITKYIDEYCIDGIDFQREAAIDDDEIRNTESDDDFEL